MKVFLFITLGPALVYALYFNLFEKAEQKISKEDLYYYKSLNLAKEVRFLNSQVSSKNFEIEQLKNKNQYYKIQLASLKKGSNRGLASVNENVLEELTGKNYGKNVDFNIYKWSEYKLYTVANNYFTAEDHKNASYYYLTLLKHYPNSKYIDEDFLMKAGLTCYKSKNLYREAIIVFDYLIKKYPQSKLKLQAKLWQGLSLFYLKKNKEFISIVEEFRNKYRNTAEWKILSNYYEKIIVSIDSH
jgi:TolA-binding protein